LANPKKSFVNGTGRGELFLILLDQFCSRRIFFKIGRLLATTSGYKFWLRLPNLFAIFLGESRHFGVVNNANYRLATPAVSTKK